MTKIQKVKKFFNKLKVFFTEDIYNLDQNAFKPVQRFFIDTYRIIVFAVMWDRSITLEYFFMVTSWLSVQFIATSV